MNPDLQVGIIFLFEGSLHFDTTPVSSAIFYGDLQTHENGHPDFWADLQGSGKVPMDVEYDEAARGRVTYDPKRGVAMLMLDRCILRRHDLVAHIREVMHLPPKEGTEVSRDSHYVCPGCSKRSKDDW